MFCKSLSNVIKSTYQFKIQAQENWNYTRMKVRLLNNRIYSPKYTKDSVKNYLSNNNPLDTNWIKVKNDFINEYSNINQTNVNAVLINMCMEEDIINYGKSFVDYLKENESHLNLGTLGSILNFYYVYKHTYNKPITDKEILHILKIYDYLKAAFPVLDLHTNENLIRGLVLTPKWKDSINILNKIKEDASPSSISYNVIANASLLNDNLEIATEILDEYTQIFDFTFPFECIYISWIDYCVRNNKNSEPLLKSLEEILYFCEKNNILINKNIALKLCDVFQDKLGWNGKWIIIDERGKCSSCMGTLNTTSISNEEYKLLQHKIHDHILVGMNPFLRSSPKEVTDFLSFLNKTQPYDFVIDTLNVSHSAKSRLICSEATVAVAKQLLTEDVKILSLGRKHVNKWPKKDLDFLKNYTHLYLVENSSYDDVFLLYASLSSKNTCFISSDLMRAQKFLLKDKKLKILFKKWQLSHQIFVKHIRSDRRVIFQEPSIYFNGPHKNMCWHIPYNANDDKSEKYEFPKNWLCLKPPMRKRQYVKHKIYN